MAAASVSTWPTPVPPVEEAEAEVSASYADQTFPGTHPCVCLVGYGGGQGGSSQGGGGYGGGGGGYGGKRHLV